MPRLAASLADQASISLGEAITGIDDRNVGLLLKAIRHASDDASSPSARQARFGHPAGVGPRTAHCRALAGIPGNPAVFYSVPRILRY